MAKVYHPLTSQSIMPIPPTINRYLRPVRSMTEEDRRVAVKLVRLLITVPSIAFSLLKPTVRNSTGVRTAMMIMPVSSKNTGIPSPTTRHCRYGLLKSLRNAPSSFWRASSTARTMSLNSASMSESGPRMRCSAARARSGWPRRTRLLGVSGTNRAPTTMTMPGTPARPREMRQPQSGMRLVK